MSTLQNNKQHTGQFDALTGIRAIAAYIVFFHHLPIHTDILTINLLQRTFYWGVDLFFVLSGFLITYRYYEKATLTKKWFFNYFVRRFARIYPLYFLVLTVVILLVKNFNLIFLIENYTLTHNLFYLFPSRGMAIPPSWSLTVEECFYLLAPFIFFIGKKYKWWLPVVLVFILLIIILLAYCKNSTDVFLIFSNSFFGCFLKFYAGVYLALMILKKQKTGRLHSNNPKWTIIGATATILLLLPLVYAAGSDKSIQFPVIIIVNNFLIPLPIAVFYYGLINENSVLKRMLSTRIMRLLGGASYAFYLIHFPLIIYFASPYIQPLFTPAYYNLYVAVTFAFTLLLSVALFVIYENPLNSFIRKRLSPDT